MGFTTAPGSLRCFVMSQSDSLFPLLPLRHGVVLPGRVTTIPVGRPRSRALTDALRVGDRVLLAVQRDPKVEDPSLVDLHSIATLARVNDKTDRGTRGVILVVEPLERYGLQALVQSAPYWMARAEAVSSVETGEETPMLASALREHLKELAPLETQLHEQLRETSEPGLLADRVAGWLDIEDEKKAEVLLEIDVAKRLRKVAELITEARAKAELRSKIEGEVRKELGKHQKEAMLRQQLRAIQKELGEGDDGKDELRTKLDLLELPEEVREVVDRELRRLDQVGANQAEGNVIRTYLQWIADLPWSERAPSSSDIDAIQTKLEEDHYGLDDVKRRILEHMAVLKLSGATASFGVAKGTILCLVGPPGVGKTSLAQSIAASIGRPLARVSLGGVRDEAEIRGHRRTYIGALPGRLISALRKAKVKNPVVMLDEIDKMGRGFQGDPEAALLEVLDPEQNQHFTDHYLEVPFDLSEVLFIATANDVSTLSPPLRDRLEIIEISGYTLDEKVTIAERHLVAGQLGKVGLPADSVRIPREIIETVARDYTREAGVRQLAREIQKIARALALEVARKGPSEGSEVVEVNLDHVRKSLGKPRFLAELAERNNAPGIAAGLAWTPVGGDILYIETTKMPGKGRIEITGQLGDVMKESVRAALAYLRSHADEFGIEPEFLEKHDLHIHVPAGAIPKDGPSAGVTMFTALASLLTGRRVRSDVAMTGEATLRGRVLPIGGVKAKTLAAHRAGFKRVILPKRNERDLEDVPESVRNDLEILLAEEMRDVLVAALEPDPVGEGTSSPGSRGESGRAEALIA